MSLKQILNDEWEKSYQVEIKRNRDREYEGIEEMRNGIHVTKPESEKPVLTQYGGTEGKEVVCVEFSWRREREGMVWRYMDMYKCVVRWIQCLLFRTLGLNGRKLENQEYAFKQRAWTTKTVYLKLIISCLPPCGRVRPACDTPAR